MAGGGSARGATTRYTGSWNGFGPQDRSSAGHSAACPISWRQRRRITGWPQTFASLCGRASILRVRTLLDAPPAALFEVSLAISQGSSLFTSVECVYERQKPPSRQGPR